MNSTTTKKKMSQKTLKKGLQIRKQPTVEMAAATPKLRQSIDETETDETTTTTTTTTTDRWGACYYCGESE